MTGIQLDNFDLKVEKKDGERCAGLGVGIEDMLLDEDLTGWTTKIRENMQMDGQRVESVKVTRQGITINSEYEG